MPKMKTNKSAAKRFKISKNGKVKHRKAYGRHLMTKKSSKRKRNLRHSALLAPSEVKKLRALMPYN